MSLKNFQVYYRVLKNPISIRENVNAPLDADESGTAEADELTSEH